MPPKRGRGRGRGAPPSREESKSVDPESIGFKFENLSVEPIFPRRPGYGRLGTKIKLVSNCFSIKAPSGFVYHYDVEVFSTRAPPPGPAVGMTPSEKKYSCMNTKRNREVINLMLRKPFFEKVYAAYDGRKNLFTNKDLNIQNKHKEDINVPEEGCTRDDTFQVVIQPVKKKETNSCAISLAPLQAFFDNQTSSSVPQEAVMALETILRHVPCMKYIPVGRSFFYEPKPGDIHPLGGGREIWFGYHQSLRLGQWSPLININLTATTFYQKSSVIKFISQVLGKSEEMLNRVPHLQDSEIIKLSKELKNLRIEVNHLSYKRKYRVLRLTRERANQCRFPIKDSQGRESQITVANYFSQQYDIRLKHPNLPCLQVAPESKRVYLPLEVCDIVKGQHCKKKLDERQMADMIKFTAIPPDKRFNEIVKRVRAENFDRDEHLRAFGLQVNSRPLELEGRVINAPTVTYNRDNKIKPKDGKWMIMKDTKFFIGAEIKQWVLFSSANPRFCSEDCLNKFANMLVTIGSQMGICIQRPVKIEIFDSRHNRVDQKLREATEKYRADLAVLVIPASDKSIYGKIKQEAETVLGLKTQCIKEESVVRKCNPPLIGNLCQKINAKMGGVNHSLTSGEVPSILNRPVIIIGADVTHPSPSHDIKPSLAAAVGSLDKHPSRYAVTCRAQTNVDENKKAIEIILELKLMVTELLKAFYRHTRKKPEKIIFYRDGVSEGQFSKVLEFEVQQIRDACTGIEADYQPGITFIVVQKRHHVRFIPEDPRMGSGNMKNIPPGTTVDTDVVHKTNFDFFLCSHFGLQGTSRPAHYTVLADDNKFTADDLHKLTYYLCHTYVRCTRSISVPAPVAYAHLAAFRARQHFISTSDMSSASSDVSAPFEQLPEAVAESIKVLEDLKNTMYFV